MAESNKQLLKVGGFVHSSGIYSYKKDNLEEAIIATGKNGLGLEIAQIGPFGKPYLGKGGAAKRAELVEILNREEVSVGPLCVCYEQEEGESGGKEVYAPDIEAIVETGGYGHTDVDIVKQRIKITKDHIDFTKYVYDQGIGSSDRAILTTHVGFFDRKGKRKQIKDAVKEVLEYCKEKKVYFAIETGSEKMEVLIDFIKEIEGEMEKEGTDIEGRLGINYDPANFYLYGTQDPLEALNVLKQDDNKKYLFGVHAKDAKLGSIVGVAQGVWKSGGDVRFGDGSVKWDQTIQILYDDLGYRGPLIIEREAQDIAEGVMKQVSESPDKLAAEIAKARKGDIEHAMTALHKFNKYVA